LAKIQRKNSSGPCAEFQVVDFDVEDDDVDIENEMLDTSIAHVGGGVGGGGCCFSPVGGWVCERGGGGYGIEGALDLDIYTYTYIYLFTYFF